MVFWNSLDIREPPTQLCNVSTGVFRKADLLKIENVVSSATITLKKLSQLHVEAALVSRIVYKQKTRLRHDKGFKKLEKVNRGLLKYLAFDIACVYRKFGKLLPSCPEEFEFNLPSKQILEWVLVSTQGFAKLFCVIADTCEETACFWKGNIQGGNMCNISLMIMGVVGRIWTYAKFLVQSACNWFSELRPYLTILQPKGVAWLPSDYEIPKDLKIWLKSPHITNSTSGVKSQQDNKNKKSIFDLIGLEDMLDGKNPYIATGNDDLPLSNCVIGLKDSGDVKKIKSEPNVSLTTRGKPLILSTEMKDLGEAVPRNVVKAKDKIKSFAIDFGKDELTQVDTTAINISKKNKKRRHTGSLREDIDESQFNSNSDSSIIVESGLDFTSESPVSKKKKRKKKKQRSLDLMQSQELINNVLETTNNTKSPIKTNNGNEGKCKVKTLNLDRIISEHQLSVSESESKVTTSKRKRKKKPKLDRHLSLINALTYNKESNPNNNAKGAKQQLLKQSQNKKQKWKNQ